MLPFSSNNRFNLSLTKKQIEISLNQETHITLSTEFFTLNRFSLPSLRVIIFISTNHATVIAKFSYNLMRNNKSTLLYSPLYVQHIVL